MIRGLNMHWRPQWTYCGLYKYLSQYNNIIKYKYSTIASDTLQFLRNNLLENYFYYDKTRMKNIFSYDETKTANISKNSTLDEAIIFYSQYYKNKQFAINVINAYQIDYKLFQFTIPEWVYYLK